MARVFELSTPLAKDLLLFRAMRGHEELGRLSEFTVWALSERRDINPGDLLGKTITVTMELRNGQPRYFNGYVREFGAEGTHGRYFQYRLVAQPWLGLLALTADCRIFQDMTVPEILAEVFGKHSVAAVDPSPLTDLYSRRDYCVQYRETDFNFVSRLMEEEGIFYFFEIVRDANSNINHTLVIADSLSQVNPCPNQGPAHFLSIGEGED